MANANSVNSRSHVGFAGKIEKASQDLGHRIGSMATDVTERANEYVDGTRGYVKESPIQSVLVAAAAGLVVGGLLTLAARRGH